MFQAIVEEGGFARAAERLNRSQSSVSYAMRTMQERLPVPLLALEGRKASLTDPGALLLRRSKALLEEARQLEHLAAALARGAEAEVRLGVEAVFPPHLLVSALNGFSPGYPDVRVQIVESVLSGTQEALLDRQVDLAITGRVPPGCLADPLLSLDFVAVAGPGHPLHRLDRPLSLDDLRVHRQLVVRDSGNRFRQDAGFLLAEQRWTVSSLPMSIRLVSEGFGYAWLPLPHIQDRLADGTLKPLPMLEGARRSESLYLVHLDRDGAGPATRALASALLFACAGFS